MSTYEFWLFLHISAVIVWVGGAATIQIFGILTKRLGDPARSATFAGQVAFAVTRVYMPASVIVLGSGFGLRGELGIDWSEPFITYGLVLWVLIAAVAFGYLAPQMRKSGERLASEGPSPELGAHMTKLMWLSRGLLLALTTVVFEMTVKLGT